MSGIFLDMFQTIRVTPLETLFAIKGLFGLPNPLWSMSRKTCFWILWIVAERAAREGPGKSQFGRIAAALARKRCSETQKKADLGLRLGFCGLPTSFQFCTL